MEKLERKVQNTWLTPIRFLRKHDDGRPIWLMRCRCGNEKEILWRNYARGLTLSCGCYREALLKSRRGCNRLPIGESAKNQLLLIYKRRAKKKKIDFTLSKEEFVELTSGNCYYCNHSPHQILNRAAYIGKGNGAYIYNGIDRLDSKKGYTKDNCVTCCRMCNYAKSNMDYEDFMYWLNNLVQYRKDLH